MSGTSTVPRLHRYGLIAAALTVLTLLSIFFVDRPVAQWVAPHVPALRGAIDGFMNGVEIAFGFPISKWLTGFALLIVALVMFAFAKARHLAWPLLFVSLTELLTRLIAGVLKNVFLRTRPFEGADRFFVYGGSSFPSGHGAHFWGLFFPIAIAFPRLRIPFLILAILVSMARVAVNDHYVGDLLGSAAIAALVAYGLSLAFRRRIEDVD